MVRHGIYVIANFKGAIRILIEHIKLDVPYEKLRLNQYRLEKTFQRSHKNVLWNKLS